MLLDGAEKTEATRAPGLPDIPANWKYRVDPVNGRRVFATCVITGLVLLGAVMERSHRVQVEKDMETMEARETNLQQLFQDINTANFDGKLPNDTTVLWADLRDSPDCPTACAGVTDWSTGKPRIRINMESIKTNRRLLGVMHHEMCHVWVHAIGSHDVHGPVWEGCMQRFP
jgi:hypothetical protein